MLRQQANDTLVPQSSHELLPPDPVSDPRSGAFSALHPLGAAATWSKSSAARTPRPARLPIVAARARPSKPSARNDQVQSWIDRKRMISVIQRG